jgi:hypothetical protein
MEGTQKMMEIYTTQAISRVILAINHYISTGDFIGHGMAIAREDKLEFIVLVNPNLPADVTDWGRLKSKLQEVQYPPFELESLGFTLDSNFLANTITLAETDLIAFADALIERPGPLRWGSQKYLIDTLGLKPWPSADMG